MQVPIPLGSADGSMPAMNPRAFLLLILILGVELNVELGLGAASIRGSSKLQGDEIRTNRLLEITLLKPKPAIPPHQTNYNLD